MHKYTICYKNLIKNICNFQKFHKKNIEIETTTSTTTTTTTTTTTPVPTTTSVFLPAYNYADYYKASQKDDLTFTASENGASTNTDYYYDDEEDSCEFCKRKSQKILFKDFCKNDISMQLELIEKVLKKN